MSFKRVPLGELLDGKGYIRGPFGSALKRADMHESGIPVYEQQHAIYGHRDFRYFIQIIHLTYPYFPCSLFRNRHILSFE